MRHPVPIPDLQQELNQGLDQLGFALDAEARHRLLEYLRLLQKWNRVYNLTAVRDPVQMVSHHLLDSLVLVRHLSPQRLLDVGTGPGLPGIPLAIAWPDRPVSLLDSNQKKTAFLRQAVAALKLRNVEVITERVERWQAPEPFGLIVSRAFSDIAQFVTSTLRLLAPDGWLAAMKGVYPREELTHLPPQVRVREVIELDVPGLNAERHLVLLERA